MKRLVWGWAAVLAVSAWTLFALGAGAADAQDFAYVANAASNSVSVIDTASNTVVATVGVGSRPFGVAITPDRARAYVTNGAAAQDLSRATLASSNPVSGIVTASNAVVTAVGGGSRAFGVAITPDGTRAYVTNTASQSVSVINTASNTVVATVGVGQFPLGVA